MSQFQVPQFIEIEERLIGPVTLRQFVYLCAGAGVCFLLFFILELWLWFVIAALVMTATAVFAFIKINGQPMSRVGLAAFFYIWKPRMFLWERRTEEEIYELPEFQKPKKKLEFPKIAVPKVRLPSKETLKSWAPKIPAPAWPKKAAREKIATAPPAEAAASEIKTRPPIVSQTAPAAAAPASEAAATETPFVIYKQEKEAFLEKSRLSSLKTGAGLKSIWQKILTTKEAIPKREAPLKPAWQRSGERYVVFRKITGERETARRVDYR